MCAANGSWTPGPADVTCKEIGKQVATIHAIYQVVFNSQYKSAEMVASINEGHMHGCFKMPVRTAKVARKQLMPTQLEKTLQGFDI